MDSTTTYRFRLNGEPFATQNPTPTGLELLQVAGVPNPECFALFQLLPSGRQPVALDEEVSLTGPRIEKFAMNLLKNKAGRSGRRDFPLEEKVEALLDDLGLEVETVFDGKARWARVAFEPPAGFAQRSAHLCVTVPSNPSAAFDMFFVSPPLSLARPRPIDGLSMQQCIGGESWQRWSRHYIDKWDPQRCNLATHLLAALTWLEREAQEG